MRKTILHNCLLFSFLLISMSMTAQDLAVKRTAVKRNTTTKRTTSSSTSISASSPEDACSPATCYETKDINTDHCEAYPWISGDALRLYFSSNRDGGHGNIYLSTRSSLSETFGKPVKLFPSLPNTYYSAALSTDELTMIVTQEGFKLYIAQRKTVSDKFGTPKPIAELAERRLYGPSLSPNGKELMAIETSKTGNFDIITAFEKNAAGAFVEKGKLDMPTGFNAMSGQFGKDGLSYYCGLEQTSNGSKEMIHYYTRPAIGAKFVYAGALPASLNVCRSAFQPSANSEGTIIAYCVAKENLWDADNIRVVDLAKSVRKESGTPIALSEMKIPATQPIFPTAVTVHPPITVQTVLEPTPAVVVAPLTIAKVPETPIVQPVAAVLIYPNPFTDHFSVVLKTPVQQNALLELFDINNKLVFTKMISAKTSEVKNLNLPAGQYAYKITADNKVLGTGVVVAVK